MSQEGKPIGKKHVKVMIALQEEFQVRHVSDTCDESTRSSLLLLASLFTTHRRMPVESAKYTGC